MEELEDAINRYAQKQQERDLADGRKKEGQGQFVNGILISAGAIVGAAAIIMSFGTAIPVVVGACAFGMTSGLYGMSLTNEGANKVILGNEGDALTVAMNPISDTIFASNPQL